MKAMGKRGGNAMTDVPDIAIFDDPDVGLVAQDYLPPPDIRSITPADVLAALRHGLADFRRSWRLGASFAAVYMLAGLLLIGALLQLGYVFAIFPVTAGFLLIGPAIAVAFYDISRRIEAGEALRWRAVAWSFTRHGSTQLLLFGGVLIFMMLLWMRAATLLYALEFGTHAVSPGALLADLRSADAIGFLLLGNAVGAVLSAVAFVISVVAVPMLLDRDVDFMTALATSIRACWRNPISMLFFASAIVMLIGLSALTGFLGLLGALPIIGHATWHVYRRTVVHKADV